MPHVLVYAQTAQPRWGAVPFLTPYELNAAESDNAF
jgi:hypothetical protein